MYSPLKGSQPRPPRSHRTDLGSYLAYNGVLLLALPLLAAYLTQRYFSGKSKPGWRERWGHLSKALQWQPGSRPRCWIHAVSAGEVVAAVPILRELRTRLPDHDLLFSVLTPAGWEMAEQQAKPYVDGVFYFPFDLPWVARRVAEWIHPQVFVSLESEMWPNILHELKRIGTRTAMVNGRISEKSFQRASRIGGGLFRWMLSNMDRLLVQSEADARRVCALGGAALEAERVTALGNSKFDQEITRLSNEEALSLRRSLKLPEAAPVFVAGSTRSAEEEEIVVAAYREMREKFPDLCLLVAPRQVDRAQELAEAMRKAGLDPVRRTRLETAAAPVRHIVLDTMGELANIYAVATLTFVGNSFDPAVKGGGQNLLQPLAHGKPVLFGPRIATIRAEAALAIEAGVGFQVEDGTALAQEGVRLLSDADVCREIERRALELIASNRGVSARYAEEIAQLANQ
jgi:3-deoxy-D-manno-octulosonic-acid transferase